MNGLGGYSVDLLVFAWIADAENERPVFFRVQEAAKLALDDAGIQIPYPQLQLFVDSVEDRVSKPAAHFAAAARQNGRERPAKERS